MAFIDTITIVFILDLQQKLKLDLCYISNLFWNVFALFHLANRLINLIIDIPPRALYETALMSHLFSDEEMRQGSVEPKETSKGKKALEQTKINLIKSSNTNLQKKK